MLYILLLPLPWILVPSEASCPAPLPCECIGDVIACNGKGLTKIPTFTKSDQLYRLLNLTDNNISEIPADIFTNIQVSGLHLRYNPTLTLIRTSAFRRLHNLTEINLSNNNLRTIETGAFRDLSGLLKLDIGHNKLKTLVKGTFENLPKFQNLFADFNELTKIEVGTFINTTSLEFLNLGFNSLVTLDYDVICHIANLRTLNVMQNKIVCACAMSWVEQWRTVDVGDQKREVYGSCRRLDIHASSALYIHIFRCSHIAKCSTGDVIIG